MTSRARGQWAVMLGVLLGTAVLVAGAGAGSEPVRSQLLGIGDRFWALGFGAVAVGFAAQLFLNQRAAARRESNLLRTASELREVSAELGRLARTDSLTGVVNRRSLFDLLGVEFRRSRRYSRDLSVLMLDLDHFKEVNDRWGHPFGDEVLRQLASLVLRNVRESDVLGRYGGGGVHGHPPRGECGTGTDCGREATAGR